MDRYCMILVLLPVTGGSVPVWGDPVVDDMGRPLPRRCDAAKSGLTFNEAAAVGGRARAWVEQDGHGLRTAAEWLDSIDVACSRPCRALYVGWDRKERCVACGGVYEDREACIEAVRECNEGAPGALLTPAAPRVT